MGAIHEKKCVNGHTWEVLEHNGVETSLAREGDACFDVTCPECGLDGTRHFAAGAPRTPHGAGYPRFDVGLGRMLESEQHRRQVMKELGVKDAEGELGRVVQEIVDLRSTAERKHQEEYTRMQEEMAADPTVRRIQARAASARTREELLAIYGGS